jgi:hypothetical protein
MTVQSLINKVLEYVRLLCYRDWKDWELLAIAITVLVVLSLVVIARLRTRASIKRLHERAPVIGMRLANRSTRR